MTLTALACLATAAPPDRMPASLTVGTGKVTGLTASVDGRVVAGVSAAKPFVLDVERWVVHEATGCDANAVAIVPNGDDTEVYLGCQSGKIKGHVFSEGTLSALQVEGADVEISLERGQIQALLWAWSSDELVSVAFGGEDEDRLSVDRVDLEALEPQGEQVLLVYDGFVDAAYSDGTLLVAHGSDDMSSVIVGNDVATVNSVSLGLNVSVDALTAGVGGTAYAADSAGNRVAQYRATSLQWTSTIPDIDKPKALALSEIEEEEWLVVHTKDGIEVFDAPNLAVTTESLSSFAIEGELTDLVVAANGITLGGSSDGLLHVLTAAPWVDDIEVAPESAVEGDVVTVSFTSDEDGDYEVLRGGSMDGDGERVATGEATAGEPIIVSFDVDASYEEGSNDLFVLVTDQDGNVGHAVAAVVVDNPPDAPTLIDESLGFSNQALNLTFTASSDADIDHYEVYVTVTPFASGDYGAGEYPEFDGEDELTTPISVDATPGATLLVRIAPLTNFTTYYVAARAFDAGGLESSMSDVVSDHPRPGFTASSLAGENGGLPCSTAPGTAGSAALLLSLLALARRSRSVALVPLLALLPSVAEAADPPPPNPPGREKKEIWHDETPQRGNFELRYGIIDLADSRIERVYGDSGNNLLQVEFGPQFLRVLEFDLGIGFFQELAFTIDDSGAESSDRTMLTWYPLMAGMTLRLHLPTRVFDEQPLVPFARYGFDWILFNEKSDDGAGGKDKVGGAKEGFHYGFGGDLLLDTFARGRASLLEAHTGINDTYLVVEYRIQNIHSADLPGPVLTDANGVETAIPRPTGLGGEGLSFSGKALTIGLKLDF